MGGKVDCFNIWFIFICGVGQVVGLYVVKDFVFIIFLDFKIFNNQIVKIVVSFQDMDYRFGLDQVVEGFKMYVRGSFDCFDIFVE